MTQKLTNDAWRHDRRHRYMYEPQKKIAKLSSICKCSRPAVIKLFGVHFRARVEFLLQISKIGGHQQNVHISSTILCSTRDSDSKQISDSKTEVIKLFEIVFMLELEYETPNFKLAAYLTSKQTQDGTAQIQRQRRRTARCKNGKIIAINN